MIRTAAAMIGVVATVAIALAWQSAPLHRRLDRIDAHLIAVIERLTALEHRIAVLELHNPPPGGVRRGGDPMHHAIVAVVAALALLVGVPLGAQEPADAESAAERVEHGLSAVEQVLDRAGVAPLVEAALGRLLERRTFGAEDAERLGIRILQAVVHTLAEHVLTPPPGGAGGGPPGGAG